MMRSKALLVGAVVAVGAGGGGVAVAAGGAQSPQRVAPMIRECQVPTAEIPPASAHLTDAQIEALCNLPGAVR